MKKLFLLFAVFILISGVAFAATFKINSSGQIKNESGKVVGNIPEKTYTEATVPYIDIVIDYSGSMYGIVNKFKDTVSQIMAVTPKTTSIGLRKVGGEYGCKTTKQLVPVEVNDTSKIMNAIELTTYGDEPLVLGVQKAITEDFANLDRTSPKKIIIITDGGYTCHDDPCIYAKNLNKTRKDIHIDIIYTGVKANKKQKYENQSFSCLSKYTNGNIHYISSPAEITKALSTSINTVSDEVAKDMEIKNNQNLEYLE